MKILKIFVLILLTSVSIYAANFKLDQFVAKSDSKNVIVEWRNSNESSISYYQLERSTDNYNFTSICTEKVKSGGYYKFVDEQAFIMFNNSNGNSVLEKNTYTYRIKVVYTDNSTAYSDVTYVIHNLNSVKRTWGMLKEMFR